MIQYFLRLFPAYRHLLEASTDKLRLQDQVIALQGDNLWLREQLSKSHDTEREAYKMMVNAAWQIQYGFKPYPEAPGIPERLAERSEAGSIKRTDHWLSMRSHGEKQSKQALEDWAKKYGQSRTMEREEEIPVLQDGDKLGV